MSLELVPIEDLLTELESRCETFIAAYQLPKEKDSELRFCYGHGIWMNAVKLSSVLNNDVLNNWDGKMKTLQRIHNEGIY